MSLLLEVKKKLTVSRGTFVLLFRFGFGEDGHKRLYAPPANNVNKDPQPRADAACSSTGGIAGSNGRIRFPHGVQRSGIPPAALQCSAAPTQPQETTHMSRMAQQRR
ncbi:Hypothetical protein SMAX5B_014842 [Scophthalmus maximus]|uniref:Uncharacterized protein n=1 Tax=Scophthalmus maximus TaxID=52904 RepID=A0A2U9C552_SCOMX|nr:Hypothetical protein SMAX5B_014842 [Scophthalmus maximus]